MQPRDQYEEFWHRVQQGQVGAVLGELGRPREALRRLSQSVALNKTKGSPLDLSYNRHALHRLTESGQLGAALTGRVLRQLSEAESRLGRVPLPRG